MARSAIYMGPRLKRLRRDLGLTQANMAADLDISPSYIALMERNQRPVTAELLLKLARNYQIDIAHLAEDDADEITARLQAILKEPMFADIDLPSLDIADVATSFPGMAEALLRLHTAFSEEQMALAARRESGAGSDAAGAGDPVAEARNFLAARRNCFPLLDDSAASLSGKVHDFPTLKERLEVEHGLKVELADAKLLAGALRWYDYHHRRVMLSEKLDSAGRRFALATQLAILEMDGAITDILKDGRFASEDGEILARRALHSYWAAALLMPYREFAAAARELRYDIEALAARFKVSFEQAVHRLTTLQRTGDEGVPFFFLRVDSAGNVSKRLDGAGFPLARHGGGCPLWNIHETFSHRGQVMTQLIELPDGDRYVSVARTVAAGGGSFAATRVVRAVALACSADHLDKLVYSEALANAEPTPIGVACRLCHRPRCIARSAPPIGRELTSGRFREAGVPVAFSGD